MRKIIFISTLVLLIGGVAVIWRDSLYGKSPKAYYDRYIAREKVLGAKLEHSDMANAKPILMQLRTHSLEFMIADPEPIADYPLALMFTDTRLAIIFLKNNDLISYRKYMREAIFYYRRRFFSETTGKSDSELEAKLLDSVAALDKGSIDWTQNIKPPQINEPPRQP